jgi:anti-repressor protein
MSSIQIFNNPQFGEVRVAELDGKTYFVGIDVTRALGYKNPNDAITRHCRGCVKHAVLDNNGVTQMMNIIPEGDIYRLAAKSELPGAEAFESWIFDEVLPNIRKNGGYMTAKENESPEEIMARALMIAQQTIDRSRQRVRELESENSFMKPKVLFADAVASSGRSVLIGELAKVLNQNGVNIGQNRLFVWLREHGYLGNRGNYYNQPSQRSMEMGLFEIKKTSITKPDGTTLVTTTTKVTGKGQIYFVNKFLTAS